MNWPRIRDLPGHEQIPFSNFLEGQTRPYMEGINPEQQDAYYPWDYENWKQRKESQYWD